MMMSEEERERVLSAIGDKLDAKEELTLDEKYIAAGSMRFDRLLEFPFCHDEYYRKVYVAMDGGVPPELYSIRDRDKVYFQGFVKEWGKEMVKTNHTNDWMRVAAKETRYELKNLRKEYGKLSYQEYRERRFAIIAWSKYRYILIKRVFEQVIRGNSATITLNGENFIMDFKTYYHIVSRHFADIQKPYQHLKDHFIPDFEPENLHDGLGQIFSALTASGKLVGQDLSHIYFRYKGVVYRVISKKARGSSDFHVETFHPCTDLNLVQDLNEETIFNDLNVFLRKTEE